MSTDTDQTPLWVPSAERVENAAITRFARFAEHRTGRSLAAYDQLWNWSVTELEQFWACLWDFAEVRASRPYTKVLGSHEMPGARWFEGAELNYAEHLLRPREPDEVVVHHASETRAGGQMTRGELAAQVARAAGGLRALGVGRGDRVVAYMPNIPETLIAMLASASLGAIWSSAAPEFGAQSVIDRFAQIEPKVLLTVDGYGYGGREFDRSEAVRALRAQLPTVAHTVVLPYLSGPAAPASDAPGTISWSELLDRGEGSRLTFEQVPFDHPLWVLYSSGTTGLPKGIVQGHGGILLEQLKTGLLHLDLQGGDRMFWFTTTGWMMWNFLIGALLTDAGIVMYDGSPAYPDLGVLWRLAQQTGMTCFGTSAGYLMSCAKEGVEPGRDIDLQRLSSIGSTGSPLPPEGFEWVYGHVKRDMWLFSASGGTDLCTAFVGGCPLLPVYLGELQCRALGAAVEAWDEDGKPLIDEVGELVLTEPMPSMPLFLWGDEDGSRYHESYFDMFPGVWRHGDWIRITPRGGAVIYGRSDATINRQGVRMGTSEIYRAATAVDEVVEALVVDVPRPDGALWMPLFVVLREGCVLDDRLTAEIRRRIREDCSPRHVPDEIIQVPEIPHTLSNKILEVPVKRILMGTAPEQAASIEALANPKALEPFVELAQRLARE